MFTSFYKKYMLLGMILSIGLHTHAAPVPTESLVATGDVLTKQRAALLQEIKEQIEILQQSLERLGLALHNRTTKVDSKDAQKAIACVRAELNKLESSTLIPFTPENVQVIFQYLQVCVAHTKELLRRDFNKIIPFDLSSKVFISVATPLEKLSEQMIWLKYDNELIRTKITQVGLPFYRRLGRAVNYATNESPSVRWITSDWRLVTYPIAAWATYKTLHNYYHPQAVPDATAKNNANKTLEVPPIIPPVLRQLIGVDFPTFLIKWKLGEWITGHIATDVKSAWDITSEDMREQWATFTKTPFIPSTSFKKSKKKFGDIISYQDEKAELDRIVEYFRDRDTFDFAGAHVNRTMALIGCPDVGKLMADALAGEITKALADSGSSPVCHLLETNPSKLLKKKMGDLVKEASFKKPCVILIEDIDQLDQVTPEILGDLVKNITDIAKYPSMQLIVIATASTDAKIPAQLLNPLCIGRTVILDTYTLKERVAFFEKELKDRSQDVRAFNIMSLARQTEGVSYSGLQQIIKQATHSVQLDGLKLTQADLEAAIDTLVHKIIPTAASDDDSDNGIDLITAYHAGQAIVFKQTKLAADLHKVTILPIKRAAAILPGGLITSQSPEQKYTMTIKDIENECVMLLAGIEAQRHLFGTVSFRMEQIAKEKVLAFLKSVHYLGLTDSDIPGGFKKVQIEAMFAEIERYSAQAAQLVARYEEQIKETINLLNKKLTITADELP